MENEKRLIDANAVIKDIDNYYNNSPFPHPGTTWLRGLELAVGLLLREPTVDAVEVVRCKDCKRWHKDTFSCDFMKYGTPVYQPNWYEEDFCSYGERRTK